MSELDLKLILEILHSRLCRLERMEPKEFLPVLKDRQDNYIKDTLSKIKEGE